MPDIDIEDNTIFLNDNAVEFLKPIQEVLTIENIVIVRLKVTGESYPGVHQNVIALTIDGEEIWRIEKNPDKVAGEHDSYTGIWEEDGELWAYNASGMAYKINKKNGEVIGKKFMK